MSDTLSKEYWIHLRTFFTGKTLSKYNYCIYWRILLHRNSTFFYNIAPLAWTILRNVRYSLNQLLHLSLIHLSNVVPSAYLVLIRHLSASQHDCNVRSVHTSCPVVSCVSFATSWQAQCTPQSLQQPSLATLRAALNISDLFALAHALRQNYAIHAFIKF